MKKLLIITIILAIIAGVVYFLWPYIKPAIGPIIGGPEPTPVLSPAPTPETNPALSSEEVFEYWTGDSGEIRYLSPAGEFYEISASGEERKTNLQKLDNAVSFKPSFNAKLALAAIGQNNNLLFSVLDFSDNSWQPLPENIVSAVWSPNKESLSYLKNSGEGSQISIFDLKTKKTSEILRFNQKDLELEWVLPEEIYLSQKPSALAASSLWSLNIKTKTIKTVLNKEPGLMATWSADGKTGLKFVNRLTAIDNSNRLLGTAPFTTLPSKCFVENSVAYCGAPTEIPPGALLPDDYLKKKIYFRDSLVAWDIESGAIKTLDDGRNQIIDAEKLKKIGNQLFFVNRYDRKLYSLELK